MAALLMRLPGQPLAIIEKRAGDARLYELDCSLLLKQHELVAAVLSAEGDAVDLEKCKVRAGTVVSVFLNSSTYSADAAFTDTPISLVCRTSQGSVQISFVLRTHKF